MVCYNNNNRIQGYNGINSSRMNNPIIISRSLSISKKKEELYSYLVTIK